MGTKEFRPLFQATPLPPGSPDQRAKAGRTRHSGHAGLGGVTRPNVPIRFEKGYQEIKPGLANRIAKDAGISR